jgi:hypothetical protein
MRSAAWVGAAAAALVTGAGGWAAPPAGSLASGPVVVVEFTNPSLSPPHWLMTLHPDGSGHFRSEMGPAPPGEADQMRVPNVSQDFQVSPKFAASVFETAQRHDWFNEPCESKMKVAFQGWKKFSYSGPEGAGSCTFNYSKDKEIQALGDSMQAVAETLLEGVRLEMLLEHDPLGLDKEIEALVEAAQDGRAQQICAIRGILERLAQDDGVMVLVRKRAKLLLARAQT